MRLVVADAGPLNYLVRIGESDVLPKLFEKVFVPEAVHAELRHRVAPPLVRGWAENPPAWLEIRPSPAAIYDDPALRALDDGERAALVLACALGADLVLMDDRAGVAVARQQGFAVTGTLGVLDLAARHGLIDLGAAFARLKATNLRYRPEIMDALLLAQHSKRDEEG
jgi:predicted nucleic acid-binding protein